MTTSVAGGAVGGADLVFADRSCAGAAQCYCAAAGAGFAVVAAFCDFFFVLSADLASEPAGGFATGDEDDVGVQWATGLFFPSVLMIGLAAGLGSPPASPGLAAKALPPFFLWCGAPAPGSSAVTLSRAS